MRPYSRDLRLRIVQAYERREGSRRHLATRFRVSLRCIRDLLTRYRATGDVAPKPPGGGSPAKLGAAGREALQALVQASPEATLPELGTQVSMTQPVTVSQAPISRAFTRLGLPRKTTVARRRARAPRGPTATGHMAGYRQATRP